MKALVKRIDQPLEVMESHFELRELQEIVGGYIEIPYIPSLEKQGIAMIINEEGKLRGMKDNFCLVKDNKIVDVIVGTVIFTAFNSEGDSIGLSDEQIAYMKEVFNPDMRVMSNLGLYEYMEV